MVTLDRYVRDLRPNEGGRSIKYQTQLTDSLYRRTLQFFILSYYKAINVFQANYTRATLICIDLSLSIHSTKLLTLNCNGEINSPL